MTPALLAFDTATEHMSIALQVRGKVFEHESAGGAQASASLIPAILALLDTGGMALGDLDAIAFGRGPGAFTGLRTACSVAQGLAFGANKPVLPIDTLLSVAEDARGGATGPLRIWVVMDARMNEIYAAQYAFADGRWTVLDPPILITPEVLNTRWQVDAPAWIAGNAVTEFADRLDFGGARLAPGARPRARALLPLACSTWAEGGALDASLALPVYLRDKVAQTTLERVAARAAKDALEARR